MSHLHEEAVPGLLTEQQLDALLLDDEPDPAPGDFCFETIDLDPSEAA
mgnify:CR=1 FL=1